MSANLIDGKKVAKLIREQVREDIQYWVSHGHRAPKLHAVIVGNNPASHTYVKAKTKACAEVGIDSDTLVLPDTVSEIQVIEALEKLNADDTVDGILLQLPLPGHLPSWNIIEAIDYRKDVDGFHPMNMGRLAVGQPAFRPCTPAGIMELFNYYSIATKGKHAVIIGASNIVGKPMTLMISREDGAGKATVTLCHQYTKDLTRHTINADILISAAGTPKLITGPMIKEGAVVIDVGINRVADPDNERGYRLVGDCDFDSVQDKANWITPVPGGVGPMTVAMLMKNTLLAAKDAIYQSA